MIEIVKLKTHKNFSPIVHLNTPNPCIEKNALALFAKKSSFVVRRALHYSHLYSRPLYHGDFSL
jgi:hypothetical protein